MKIPIRRFALCFVLLAVVELIVCPLTVTADDSFALARQQMVSKLAGGAHGITNARVLDAIGKVPRHEFVSNQLRS